ncbi:hypothetical protein BDK51DRAFT_42596 [Blyttiomyces helicus]|uniref:Uncharacterized protein n=1 Tax=Blyttiomyces helicus TaxID=388810 RepID=A0A4P9W648_9FUNG|nr:hypothetical protein BDK51DRAFT_42596 [Blyttiomyces helicus]|eukprot:RKO87921.1 hypothetical protein BDK51DRAFT_42596 [Blyttiomyces helicus]
MTTTSLYSTVGYKWRTIAKGRDGLVTDTIDSPRAEAKGRTGGLGGALGKVANELGELEGGGVEHGLATVGRVRAHGEVLEFVVLGVGARLGGEVRLVFDAVGVGEGAEAEGPLEVGKSFKAGTVRARVFENGDVDRAGGFAPRAGGVGVEGEGGEGGVGGRAVLGGGGGGGRRGVGTNGEEGEAFLLDLGDEHKVIFPHSGAPSMLDAVCSMLDDFVCIFDDGQQDQRSENSDDQLNIDYRAPSLPRLPNTPESGTSLPAKAGSDFGGSPQMPRVEIQPPSSKTTLKIVADGIQSAEHLRPQSETTPQTISTPTKIPPVKNFQCLSMPDSGDGSSRRGLAKICMEIDSVFRDQGAANAGEEFAVLVDLCRDVRDASLLGGSRDTKASVHGYTRVSRFLGRKAEGWEGCNRGGLMSSPGRPKIMLDKKAEALARRSWRRP